jgi:hypothetical protein
MEPDTTEAAVITDVAITETATTEIDITATMDMPMADAALTGATITGIPGTVTTIGQTPAPATVIPVDGLTIAGDTAQEVVVDSVAAGFVLTPDTADGRVEGTVSRSTAADIAVDGRAVEDRTAEDIAPDRTAEVIVAALTAEATAEDHMAADIAVDRTAAAMVATAGTDNSR